MSEPPEILTRDNLPLNTRQLPVSTVDPERRTVDLCFATETPVRMYDWMRGRYFEEVLSLDPAHVNLDRLNSGAPVLNTHDRWDLNEQLGVVERAWLKPNEGWSTVRFSKRADVEPIFQDVVDGIIRSVSAGYVVRAYQIEEREGALPRYTAIDWSPIEVSMVSVPADANAGIRSAASSSKMMAEYYSHIRFIDQQSAPAAEPQQTPANSATNKERVMDSNDNQNATPGTAPVTTEPAGVRAAPATNPTPATTADPAAELQRGIQMERERTESIRTLCTQHGMEETFVRGLITDGVTIEAARERVLDQLVVRSGGGQNTPPRVETVQDETETRHRAIEDSVFHRAFGGELPKHARQYRGMSLVDLARESVERTGANVRGLTRSEVVDIALNNTRASGMHTTSDFPVLMANVANRSMQRGYQLAGQTFWPLVNRRNATDFKDIISLIVGNSVELKEVNEAGEFEIGQINDADDQRFKLRTYGRIINISRQVIINDDIGVFDATALGFGRSAANLESNLVWGLITGTGKMADNKPLFHADHHNIAATASGIDIDAIDALDQLINGQTAPKTEEDINLSGKFILVPRTMRLAAQRSIGFVSATKVDDLNPMAGQYEIISDPRLARNSKISWYLAADPVNAPTIDVAYLDGNGIVTTYREGFEVDGVQVKGRIDFGCGAQDYRWIAKNDGV